jgi:hypothetical protein
MSRGPGRFTILAITSLFVFTSCATSTELYEVWKDSAYDGGFIESVMVVGVHQEFDKRKLFEDEFVSQLERYKVRAVSIAAVTSPNEEPNKEIVLTEAKNTGTEVILVTHFVGIDRVEEHHPDATRAAPRRAYAFDRYAYLANDFTKYGGSYSEKKYVKLQTHLYEAKTERLIWSASSETIDPKSVDDGIDSLCGAVMNSLRENKLIR